MTIEYDPKSDICPICGAYWEHDFEQCASDHGFKVDKSDSLVLPKLPSEFSVAVYVPYRMLRRQGLAGKAIRLIQDGLRREGVEKTRFRQDRYPFGYETEPPGIVYVGVGVR